MKKMLMIERDIEMTLYNLYYVDCFQDPASGPLFYKTHYGTFDAIDKILKVILVQEYKNTLRFYFHQARINASPYEDESNIDVYKLFEDQNKSILVKLRFKDIWDNEYGDVVTELSQLKKGVEYLCFESSYMPTVQKEMAAAQLNAILRTKVATKFMDPKWEQVWQQIENGNAYVTMLAVGGENGIAHNIHTIDMTNDAEVRRAIQERDAKRFDEKLKRAPTLFWPDIVETIIWSWFEYDEGKEDDIESAVFLCTLSESAKPYRYGLFDARSGSCWFTCQPYAEFYVSESIEALVDFGMDTSARTAFHASTHNDSRKN